MVKQVMSGWSWEEYFDALQRARLARRIVNELDARLHPGLGPRLYAATLHPVLFRHLKTALDEIAAGSKDLWRVARPRRADAHVTPDRGLFVRVLPVLFEFGPPEISVLTFVQAPGATLDGLSRVITEIMAQTDASSGAVRMDFDSGDLFRII